MLHRLMPISAEQVTERRMTVFMDAAKRGSFILCVISCALSLIVFYRAFSRIFAW